MPIVKESAVKTIETCKQKFKLHRWNCSSLEKVPILRKDLTKGIQSNSRIYLLKFLFDLPYNANRDCPLNMSLKLRKNETCYDPSS